MGNKELLETLSVLGEGTNENSDKITNILIGNLKNLDVDLRSNLKEIAKIFPENEENLYVYGRLCYALNYIFHNQPIDYKPYRKKISDKDYIEEYKRFLRVWSSVHRVRDIGDIDAGLYDSDILYMDGIRALKIYQVDDSDKIVINGVKHNIKERYEVENNIKWGVLRLDDKKDNIGAIFINEGKKEEIMTCNTIEDRVKILRRLATDNFDYAITLYLGCKLDDEGGMTNKILYNIYEKCEIEKLEDDKALNLISLLEYASAEQYDRIKPIKGMRLGKIYLKFRGIKNLSCSAILALLINYRIFTSFDGMKDIEKEKIFNGIFNAVKGLDKIDKSKADKVCMDITENLEDWLEDINGEDADYTYNDYVSKIREMIEEV